MKTETIQLTGDSFYYLRDDEEPIDPDNLEEAEEFKTLFGNFRFISEPEPIIGTDMVEAKISVAERKKIAGQFIFEFIILPDKKAHVRVFDLKTNYEERNQIQDLEPMGDAYWVEYRYHSTSRCRDLLPVCKIHEYEKWFGKS